MKPFALISNVLLASSAIAAFKPVTGAYTVPNPSTTESGSAVRGPIFLQD
jgi:hypothetical protein